TAARLAPLLPPARSVPALRDAELRLQTALAGAAGVPAVVGAVGRAYERRGLAAVGWPPLRWIHHLRPDPLRRLGLGQSGTGDEVLRRTSLPSASAASRAGVDSAARLPPRAASGGGGQRRPLARRRRVGRATGAVAADAARSGEVTSRGRARRTGPGSRRCGPRNDSAAAMVAS